VPFVGRHPTKEELDSVSATQPVFVIDSSGHHASVNSAMLKLLGYTKDTKNPEGEIILGGGGGAQGRGTRGT
jgi:predicted amidohydrolase YtcJ